MKALPFAEALGLLESGRVARRASWPEGSTVRLVPGNQILVGGKPLAPLPYFQVRLASPDFGMPWHATSPDLLARDWEVLP